MTIIFISLENVALLKHLQDFMQMSAMLYIVGLKILGNPLAVVAADNH
jgi:hypothetical protein